MSMLTMIGGDQVVMDGFWRCQVSFSVESGVAYSGDGRVVQIRGWRGIGEDAAFDLEGGVGDFLRRDLKVGNGLDLPGDGVLSLD
jgi:hypothetical protein